MMNFVPYFEVKIWIFCTEIQIIFFWTKIGFLSQCVVLNKKEENLPWVAMKKDDDH